MSVETNKQFDLIIIGGGLAGASLACALKDSALKIAVVEAFPLKAHSQPSYDDRTVALSYGSRCIFDGMGLWSSLVENAQAIDSIHISDRGHFGVTRLTKQQEGVAALGYVIENKRLGEQLYLALESSDNITLFCPATLRSIQQDENNVTIEIDTVGIDTVGIDAGADETPQVLQGKLLVAADGNNSQVKRLLNIGSSQKSYDQFALITNVTPGKKHNNVAYERFTDSGPLAFLPMQNNRCSVVWTLNLQQAEYLYALDDEDFLDQLQQRFGFRLGRLKKVGVRQMYPLSLQSAIQTTDNRVVIIGNAAHSVHPVAGQGFNLALRDVALLSELVVDENLMSADIGSQAMLQSYVALREQDIKRVYRLTDTLVRTFSNSIAALAHLRSGSLFMVDILPGIKHQLANHSMGLSGRLSRLSRGSGL